MEICSWINVGMRGHGENLFVVWKFLTCFSRLAPYRLLLQINPPY